jgi:hypothetical protein
MGNNAYQLIINTFSVGTWLAANIDILFPDIFDVPYCDGAA